MIDIHSHILPGVDDGASSVEESIELIRELYNDGIRVVVATPHVMPGAYENTDVSIADGIRNIQGKIADENIDVKILPGAENYIVPDIVERLKESPDLAINHGKFVLIELPMHSIPPFTQGVFSALVQNGFFPILAHPERNSVIMEDVERVIPLICAGALLQVNLGSIWGLYDKFVLKTAETLLKRDMVFAMASDIHRPMGLPVFSKAREIVSGWIGPERTKNIFELNPNQICHLDL